MYTPPPRELTGPNEKEFSYPDGLAVEKKVLIKCINCTTRSQCNLLF